MRIASSLAFVFATVVACSGSDGETVFVAISPTTQQALTGTLCNKYQECLGDLFLQFGFGSMETCKARALAQLQLEAKAPSYGTSEQAGAACNTAVASATCADILTGSLPEACRVKGTLADGTSCITDSQCASGSCNISDEAKCGICGPRAAAGADCTNANCEYGLKCGSNKTCTNGQPDATCTKDEDCRWLAVCRSGKCAELLAENAPCDAQFPPDANKVPCNLFRGLYCKAPSPGDRNGTCQKAQVTSASNGDRCGLVALNPVTLAVCTNAECKNERCVPHVADGTACKQEEKLCQPPAQCRAGFCSMKDSTSCQ